MTVDKPAALGGFILGAFALIAIAILFFGGRNLFESTTRAVVFFEGSVGGLAPGAPVTFRGVRVGSVSSVALVLDTGDLKAHIPVYVTLEPEQVTLAAGTATSSQQPLLRRLIAAGLRAKLVPQSLVTGQMLVDLDLKPDGSAQAVVATDAGVPEIPATQSDLDELKQQLTQAPIAATVEQAKNALAAIEKVANRIDNEIGPLASGAERFIDSATRTADVATEKIQRLQQDASATLDEVQALARDGRNQLHGRGEELSRALLTAEQTLHSAETLLTSANSLISPRSPTRNDLDATLRDLAASASSIRDLSATLDRNPAVVLYGRPGR